MFDDKLIYECSNFFYSRSDLINSFIESTSLYTNLELKKIDCIDDTFIESYIKTDLKEYEDIYCNKLNPETIDSSQYYDALNSREIWLYQELREYRNISVLQSLSTISNYFEKSLRELLLQLENEFKQSNIHALDTIIEAEFLSESKIQRRSTTALVNDILSKLHYSIDKKVVLLLEQYSDLINVYKHGKGTSFNEIANSKFFDKEKIKLFNDDLPFSASLMFNHNIFALKNDYIKEYSNSIINFWKNLLTESSKNLFY